MVRPQPPPRPGNRLLPSLPDGEYRRLSPGLQPVTLEPGQVLYEVGAVIGHAYFPGGSVLSFFAVMENGSTIELATVGREGMVGLAIALGDDRAPSRVVVQVPGDAVRLRADVLRDEARRG